MKKIHLVLSFAAILFVGIAIAAPAFEQDIQYHHPVIKNFGKVVSLPNASHQPRPDSKLVVDITKGGEPTELNGAIEKVARFVNIYAGAGMKPAKAEIAVVLHGDATLAALNDIAYQKTFGVPANPSLKCIEQLHDAGVQFYVCGQSLIGKGGDPNEVAKEVSVAVSALTSLANLQADGYAYIPMLK